MRSQVRLHMALHTSRYFVLEVVRTCAPSLQVVRCKSRVLTSIWSFGRHTTKCYVRTFSKTTRSCKLYASHIRYQSNKVLRPLERQAPPLDQQCSAIVFQHVWLTIKANSRSGQAIISSPNHQGTSGSRMRDTQWHIKTKINKAVPNCI